MKLPLAHEPGVWPDPWSRLDSRSLEFFRYITPLPKLNGWQIPDPLSSTNLFHTPPDGKVAVLVSVLQSCTWNGLSDVTDLFSVLPPLRIRVGNRDLVQGCNVSGDEGAAEVKALAMFATGAGVSSGFIQVERIFSPVYIPSLQSLFLTSQGSWIADAATGATGTFDIRIVQGEPVRVQNWLRFTSPVFAETDRTGPR